MLKRCTFPLLAFVALTLAPAVDADPLVPTVSNPKNFSEYQYGLGEVRENIDAVSCGGFANGTNGQVSGVRVTGDVPVPTVSDDFPGRNNIDPLGNPTSGLSYRGNFQFPDSVFGLSSACDVFLHEYIDPDLEKKEIDLVWHIDKPDDPKTKVTFEIKRGGTGRVETNPERWCERYPKATPAWCLKLYTTLGDLKKFADDHPEDLRPNPLTLCPDPNSPGPPKLYCFDFKSECHGSECATDEMPDFFNKLAECAPGAPDPDGNPTYDYTDYGYQVASQSSFYRHYQGMVAAPTKTWQVRAECYEWYKGTNKDKTIFDPKTTVTTGIGDGGGKDNDEQCEIVIKTPSEQSPLPPEWPDQEGDAVRKQKENVPLSSSASSEPARDPRPAPELWVTDDQTNLSIVDIKKLRELQKGFDDPDDITGAIGAIIPAKQRASATTPEHARTDAFDHTDHRDFAAFWEAQQRELLTMTRDPTVRLLLPARFLMGLRTASPLFQYVNGTVSKSDGTVELTLRAGGDDLGSAVRTLMETYVLPISEVPVPILIPITTADEIDKLIAQWKQWKLYPENAPYRTRADALIARLQSYQVALRRNQLLRTALEKELTYLYEPIRTFSGKMATWTKDNTDTLLKAAEHAKQRQQLKRIWRHIQNSMLQADACLLQWCSNQRYSVPVYSLLDNWWGDAPGQSPRNQHYLPPDDLRSLAYRAPADQVYDFSSLSLPRSQMRIPVLEVIQTALRLPTPPLAGSAPLPASEYKDIPMVPNPADILSAFPVPDVKVASLPTIPDPVLPDLEPAKTILRTLRVKIDGTSIDQQKFEEAFEDEENGGVAYDEGDDIPLDRHTMRGAYCRFPPSITAPPDPEQKSAIPQKIIHIENDLRERIAFAFSRWMPERTEDFAGRVARLHQEFPVPSRQPKCHEDIVCAFLPNTKTTTVTWQLFLPTVTVNVTAIADRLKALTLPASESKNPYINAPSPLLKRLFPNLPLPIDIDLSP